MNEPNEIQERMERARTAEARKLFAGITDWQAVKDYAARNMEICKNEAISIDIGHPDALAKLGRAQGRHDELKRLFRLELDVQKRLKPDFKE